MRPSHHQVIDHILPRLYHTRTEDVEADDDFDFDPGKRISPILRWNKEWWGGLQVYFEKGLIRKGNGRPGSQKYSRMTSL